MKNKEIDTIVTAVYTGDKRAVAAETKRKIPENHEDIVAKHTKKTIEGKPNKGLDEPPDSRLVR